MESMLPGDFLDDATRRSSAISSLLESDDSGWEVVKIFHGSNLPRLPFIAEPSRPTRLTRSVGSENRSERSMDFNASRNDAVGLVAVEECAVSEQTGSRGSSESGKI